MTYLLSDVVISMVTQTPRLSTAACEEQHSAAQRSHDQGSSGFRVQHTNHLRVVKFDEKRAAWAKQIPLR
ncbi:unnamed protein product [Caretta caretta]